MGYITKYGIKFLQQIRGRPRNEDGSLIIIATSPFPAILARSRYPIHARDSTYELQTAKRLEAKYPEAILKYYLSGLGNLKTKAPRKEYARKARVMKKVRRVLVDVLRDPSRWRDFAIKVKKDNIKRPAFQEEFAKAIPGWQTLK